MKGIWNRLKKRARQDAPIVILENPGSEVKVTMSKRKMDADSLEIEGFCILGKTYLFERVREKSMG